MNGTAAALPLLAGLTSPPDLVVHIGAGAGTELPAYLAAGAGAVLLVEGRPDTAAELAARCQGEAPRVTVRQAVVSGNPGRRPFFQTNFPDLDSLRPPVDLRDLFPGLRILAADPVASVTPDTLLADRLEADGFHVLVLETPGEALGILRNLETAGLLHRFSLIGLREWRARLYEASPPLEDIVVWLREADFRTEIEPAPEDAERPWLTASPDRVAIARSAALTELKQGLAAAEARIAALIEDRDGARQEIETAAAALAEQKTRAETLAAERDTARQDAEAAAAAREEQAARADALMKERNAAQETAAARVRSLTQAQERIDAQLKEYEATNYKLQKQATELEEARAKIDTLTQERDAALQGDKRRQAQFHDEMLKADAQLLLLKELLVSQGNI